MISVGTLLLSGVLLLNPDSSATKGDYFLVKGKKQVPCEAERIMFITVNGYIYPVDVLEITDSTMKFHILDNTTDKPLDSLFEIKHSIIDHIVYCYKNNSEDCERSTPPWMRAARLCITLATVTAFAAFFPQNIEFSALAITGYVVNESCWKYVKKHKVYKMKRYKIVAAEL